MHYTILDCYTDEASGLGVPPYLGTYPRYIYGQLISERHSVSYITIDDLRLWKKFHGKKRIPTEKEKTSILTYNLTTNDLNKVIPATDVLIVILGVHVPGKYLTALPGTLHEVIPLIKDLPMQKILTGPAIFGTQLEGGKFFEKEDLSLFTEVKDYTVEFNELQHFFLAGVEILTQIPSRRVIEIETGRGCNVGKCSFCTEPIKSKFINRKMEDVLAEVIAYYKAGARFFRLGKQADFYACDRPIELLQKINQSCPDIEVLHIDNVNPNSVVARGGEEITKAIVQYCTPGNIAAFGVESFDPVVVKANLLNTMPIIAHKAIEIINKYGAQRGENGMPKFLPGINIRQVAVLPNTFLEAHGGAKYLNKNKKYYWKWRNQIRQEIDFPMLERILPKGTILKDVFTEMYDGKTTFCRQMGTYPLVIGIKGRLPLNERISVKVTGYMLRSITGEKVD